jgi:ATP-dependent Clp protease ATP-binding subunit ClpB
MLRVAVAGWRKGHRMNIEKYTERARGSFSRRRPTPWGRGTSNSPPEHLLKVLLDDQEGMAAGLIERAGGRAKDARLPVEAALGRLPKVSGGSGQLYLGQPLVPHPKCSPPRADRTKRSGVFL